MVTTQHRLDVLGLGGWLPGQLLGRLLGRLRGGGRRAAGGPNDSCVGQTGRPTPVMVMGTVSVKVAGPLLHRCSVATPTQQSRDPGPKPRPGQL